MASPLSTHGPRRNRQQPRSDPRSWGWKIKAVPSEVSLSEISSAVRSEYARILVLGRDDLLAVSFNAALVTVCWFLLPDSIRNWLFALHGPLVFPFILEMWMLGDTPATNVAGRDAVRALAQLEDPSALRMATSQTHRLDVLCRPDCRNRGDCDRHSAAPQYRRSRGSHLLALPTARRVERRSVDQPLDALSPAEAAMALATSFRPASSATSVGCPFGPPLSRRASHRAHLA